MGVTARLRQFAFAEPAAFPIFGLGGAPAWRRFAQRHPVRVTRAPHDADLLVLAGEIPPHWMKPLRALFETFALPRAAVWLPPDWPCAKPEDVPLADDPQHALFDPAAPNNRQLLEDKPPSPWRGQGDHGQGGEGMMGGKPYGRPMAMTGSDRDGLMLGAVRTSLGPFFPGLPSGLQLELTMQGDRIEAVAAVRNWFLERPADDAVAPELAPALRAMRGEQVRVAEIESARVCSHLAWASSFLELAGLEALSRRFGAGLGGGHTAELAALFQAAERTGLRWVCGGVGQIPLDAVRDLGLAGPVARASGQAADARAGAPGYPGFEVQVAYRGDVWSRWQVRRDECLQSARLVEEAGARLTVAPEAPRGPILATRDGIRTPSRANLGVLKDVLPGLLWSEAILTIASLDLDMAEAALR